MLINLLYKFNGKTLHYYYKYTTCFTTIEAKVDVLFLFSWNFYLNENINSDYSFAFDLSSFMYFITLSVFRFFLHLLLNSPLYPLSPLICWRVSDISWCSPVYYSPFLFPSRQSSIVPRLRASFCWAFDGEIPRFAMLVWRFLFVLYFSLLLGALIATSWFQFLTIERFPRATQQISQKKYLGMISIIAPKWRYMETIWEYYRRFRDFLFRIIRQRFTPPPLSIHVSTRQTRITVICYPFPILIYRERDLHGEM